MLTSKKWQFNVADLDKWLINGLVFIAPVMVIYILFVIANINTEGIQWSDFVPNNFVIGSMTLYVLNIALDFFKKLSKNN